MRSVVDHSTAAWRDDALPGVTTDDEEMRASLAWVRRFARRDVRAAALTNHDPAVSPRTIR